MAQVFTRFDIYNRSRGGTLLSWDIHPLWKHTPPVTFTVLASRSGTGDWLTAGTVVNNDVFEDLHRWVYGKEVDLHYQIKAVDTASVTVYSDVKQALGNFPARFRAIAREMIRKELLIAEQDGQCGYLYKRRKWGVKCPTCLDYDTEQVTSSHCPTCYGTGFIDGYFDPVMYWVRERDDRDSRYFTDLRRGFVNDKVMFVRGINCPWIESNDIWVDFDSDRRHVIHTVKHLNFRGVTIMFDPIELRLAPTTDMIYELERPADE